MASPRKSTVLPWTFLIMWTGCSQSYHMMIATSVFWGKSLAARQPLGHRAGQRLAGEMGDQVGVAQVRHRLAGRVGRAADVGREDYVVHLAQGLRHLRFAVEHVQAGAGDPSLFQRI